MSDQTNERTNERTNDRMRRWGWPVGIALVTALVLALFAGDRLFHQSRAAHFVYQSMAFLQGRMDIPVRPPNLEDWVLYQGRWYVSFPAFPAIAMLPFVAIFGYQFNDTSWTVGVAALAIALFFGALRKFSRLGDSPRSEGENAALALLMAFGTLFFYCSIRGEVWFTAEVLGVGLTSLYLFFAVRARRPLMAGLAWSMAVLTRTPLLFAVAFFLCELWFPEGRLSWAEARRGVGEKLRRGALFALGAAPLGLAHALFNYARFGKFGEFGHRLFLNNRVNDDIVRWGLFHPHYLLRNLHSAFLKLPTVELSPFRLGYDPHGLSLFLTTPLFLFLLVVAFARLGRAVRPRLQLALWLTIACTAIPGLFYQNDGYVQFGFRFSLDYTPFLFALLAVGGWSLRRPWFVALAAFGIGVNTWGALAFHGFSW